MEIVNVKLSVIIIVGADLIDQLLIEFCAFMKKTVISWQNTWALYGHRQSRNIQNKNLDVLNVFHFRSSCAVLN
jgi:hypothetical protein